RGRVLHVHPALPGLVGCGVLVVWEQVEECPRDGVADGLSLVGDGALGRGAPQLAAQARADGLVVVRGPGVVHAGDNDPEHAGADGRTGPIAIMLPGGRLEGDVEPVLRARVPLARSR